MAVWMEEQLITFWEGRFVLPKKLMHPIDHIADPVRELERKVLIQEVAAALSEIGEKEATILRLRFGLGAEASPMGIDEVAARMAISRGRAIQIEELALLRLRRVLSRMGYLS